VLTMLLWGNGDRPSSTNIEGGNLGEEWGGERWGIRISDSRKKKGSVHLTLLLQGRHNGKKNLKTEVEQIPKISQGGLRGEPGRVQPQLKQMTSTSYQQMKRGKARGI